jgi:predicted flavoprotein YhiN
MLHHVRHGAALLFTQLGLKGAARLDGWVNLKADWQVRMWDHVAEGLIGPLAINVARLHVRHRAALLFTQLGLKGAACMELCKQAGSISSLHF